MASERYAAPGRSPILIGKMFIISNFCLINLIQSIHNRSARTSACSQQKRVNSQALKRGAGRLSTEQPWPSWAVGKKSNGAISAGVA
jgi:hypothetical protein